MLGAGIPARGGRRRQCVPRLLLWTVSSRGRKVTDSGPRGGSLTSIFCVPTGTSGPGGARAAKSIAATSRAAGHHHLPATERSSRCHGGDLELFLTALAHHQLLTLGLRRCCHSPGAAESRGQGSAWAPHHHGQCPERQRGGMERRWENWPKMHPCSEGRGSEHRQTHPNLASRAEESPPELHQPRVHP